MATKILALTRLLAAIAAGLSFEDAQIEVRRITLISDREWDQVCVAHHLRVLADLKRRQELARGLVFLMPQAE